MELLLYSTRWQAIDNYTIDKTLTGWRIQFLGIGGECDKTGSPYLYENLRHDGIQYPVDLGLYFEYLWNKAEERNLTDSQIQVQLNRLGFWLRLITMRSPKGIWKTFR